VYLELKGWQTAIGSVLGFLALMVAALWNFHLNRRRDARVRNEEVVAIATGLYGEIINLRRHVARMAQGVGHRHFSHRFSDNQYNIHFFEMYPLPEPTLYPALASKIGLLPGSVLLGVVGFYESYAEAKRWLPKLQEDPTRPYSYSVTYVLRPAISAVDDVVPTLREIQRMSGLSDPIDQHQVDQAHDAVEMEEELHAQYDGTD
jgi:hypothetical protein